MLKNASYLMLQSYNQKQKNNEDNVGVLLKSRFSVNPDLIVMVYFYQFTKTNVF